MVAAAVVVLLLLLAVLAKAKESICLRYYRMTTKTKTKATKAAKAAKATNLVERAVPRKLVLQVLPVRVRLPRHRSMRVYPTSPV